MNEDVNTINICIVYDSAYGNTKLVAQALAGAVYGPHEARLVPVGEVGALDLQGIDVLLVGSPTQGGMATKPIQEYIASLAPYALKGISVAAFDTRYAISEHGIGLKILMKTIGFGAPRIATGLVARGGKLIVKPEGFLVQDEKGPLKEGELERAEQWMQEIIELCGG